MLLVAGDMAHDHHDAGDGHPEQRARLAAAFEGLADSGLGEGIRALPLRLASPAELATVHDVGYLKALADLCAAGGGPLDGDIAASPGSWETARLTAGAGLAAAEALAAGSGAAALVLGRPPGHHATRHRAMGFCLINNVAVTAAALADRGERGAHRRLGRTPRQRDSGHLSGPIPGCFTSRSTSGRFTRGPDGPASGGPGQATARRSTCRCHRAPAAMGTEPYSTR